MYGLFAAGLIAAAFGAFKYQKYRVPPGVQFAELKVVSEFQATGPFREAIGQNAARTIVVFGQSWCHDCHRELPRLQQFRQKLFSRANVVVLTDEGLRTMMQWKTAVGLPFLYLNTVEQFESLGVHAYPTTYILDQNLKVLFSQVGNVDWESPELTAIFSGSK